MINDNFHNKVVQDCVFGKYGYFVDSSHILHKAVQYTSKNVPKLNSASSAEQTEKQASKQSISAFDETYNHG